MTVLGVEAQADRLQSLQPACQLYNTQEQRVSPSVNEVDMELPGKILAPGFQMIRAGPGLQVGQG